MNSPGSFGGPYLGGKSYTGHHPSINGAELPSCRKMRREIEFDCMNPQLLLSSPTRNGSRGGLLSLMVLGVISSFNTATGNPPPSKAELNKAQFVAASHDRIADIKSLIAQGADVNSKGPEGLTPFMEVAVDIRGMTALSNAAFLEA